MTRDMFFGPKAQQMRRCAPTLIVRARLFNGEEAILRERSNETKERKLLQFGKVGGLS